MELRVVGQVIGVAIALGIAAIVLIGLIGIGAAMIRLIVGGC